MIPLAYKTTEELLQLVDFLQEKGYLISETILNHIGDKRYIPAVMVNEEEKEVHATSITIMACWCNSTRRPLYIHEFIELYDRIITQGDRDYYESLIKEISKDETRPIGVLLKVK